jgi:uncharacterized protein with HEPN domain
MSGKSLRLLDYLDHILESISRIEAYTAGLDKESFLATTLVQDAVIRNFEIIGEASRRIGRLNPEFVASNPKIPFMFAYDMRNVLAHADHKVELEIIWKTVQTDLLSFKEQIHLARQKVESS